MYAIRMDNGESPFNRCTVMVHESSIGNPGLIRCGRRAVRWWVTRGDFIIPAVLNAFLLQAIPESGLVPRSPDRSWMSFSSRRLEQGVCM